MYFWLTFDKNVVIFALPRRFPITIDFTYEITITYFVWLNTQLVM